MLKDAKIGSKWLRRDGREAVFLRRCDEMKGEKGFGYIFSDPDGGEVEVDENGEFAFEWLTGVSNHDITGPYGKRLLDDAKIGDKWVDGAGKRYEIAEIGEKSVGATCSDGLDWFTKDGVWLTEKDGRHAFNPSLGWNLVSPYNEPAKITVVQSPAPNVLHEALAVAGNGAERARDYGHPFDNHERIARLWNAYDANKPTPGPDTAKDVAMKMALLKVAREQNTHKRDNLVDIAGYILCAEQIVAKMEGK